MFFSIFFFAFHEVQFFIDHVGDLAQIKSTIIVLLAHYRNILLRKLILCSPHPGFIMSLISSIIRAVWGGIPVCIPSISGNHKHLLAQNCRYMYEFYPRLAVLMDCTH